MRIFCGLPNTHWGDASSCDWTQTVNSEPKQGGYVMRKGIPGLIDLVREECGIKL